MKTQEEVKVLKIVGKRVHISTSGFRNPISASIAAEHAAAAALGLDVEYVRSNATVGAASGNYIFAL